MAAHTLCRPAVLLAAWVVVSPHVALAQRGWSGSPTLVGPPWVSAGMASGPDIAFDAFGHAFAVWAADEVVQAATTTDIRTPWSAPIALSTRGGLNPQVVVDDAGNAVVVWERIFGPIQAVRYTASSGSWLPVVDLAPTADGHSPRLDIDAAGNVMAAWWTTTGGIQAARFTSATGTWAPATTLSLAGQSASQTSVAVDAAGNAFVVWQRAGVIQARRYLRAGDTWEPTVDLSPPSGPLPSARDPHLAVDPAGNAIVVWTQLLAGPGGGIRAARFAATSGVWGAAVSVAGDPSAASPRSACAPNGDAIAVWYSTITRELQAAHFTATGGTWSEPRRLGLAGSQDPFTRVAIDAAGNAIAVWVRVSTWPLSRIAAARYVASSDTWLVPDPLSESGLSVSSPQIAFDIAGNASALWMVAAFGYNGVQHESWLATPSAPLVTAVTPASGALTVSFTPGPESEPAFALTNLAYSLDDGGTWIARDPASPASPLTIDGLTDFTRYTLRLRGINAAGAGEATGPLAVVSGTGTTAPTDLTVAFMAGNRVTLAWTPPSVGIIPFEYRLDGGPVPGEARASLPAGAGPRFTFDAPTGAFYVRIVPVLDGLMQMPPSNEVRIFVNTPTPPSPPVGLRGLVNGDAVTLSWTNTFIGGAPASLRLHVFGAVTTTLPLPLGETFSFAGVPPGAYTLSVSAVNGDGASAVSNAVLLTVPGPCTGVPAPPTSLQTWKLGATIFLAWSAPATGPAVSGYTVVVSGAYVGTFPTTGRSLSGVAGPGRYVLSVVANNACGTGPPTPEQVVVIP